uniref:Uncharacterized protein n=1 Tax=Oryza nivara TaxID=4536 RepID=A0A0E0H2A9_ORYNI
MSQSLAAPAPKAPSAAGPARKATAPVGPAPKVTAPAGPAPKATAAAAPSSKAPSPVAPSPEAPLPAAPAARPSYSSVLRLVSNNSDEDFDREVYRLAHLRPLVSKAASQRSQDDFTNFSYDDEFEYSSGVLVDSVSDVLCDDFSDEDFQYEEVDARYYRVRPEIESEVICGKEKSIARTAHATLD